MCVVEGEENKDVGFQIGSPILSYRCSLHCFPAYLSLSFCISLSRPVSLFLFFSLSLSLSVSLAPFSLSLPFLSLPSCFYICLPLTVSVCLCLPLLPTVPSSFSLPCVYIRVCLPLTIFPESTHELFFLLLPTDTFPSPASLQGLCCIFQVSAAHYFSFSGAGSSGFHQTKDLSLGSF